MSKKRVIILASERSGTNLLRVLLGKHKDISAPVPAHFFNAFKAQIHLYGDLNKVENCTKLMTHFLSIANHPFSDWKIDTPAKELVNRFDVNSFQSAFDAIHREFAAKEKKIHYVSKDNDLYNHIDLIEDIDSDEYTTQYIYLYRDPRDQVVSWLKTPLFLHTVFDIASKWNKEQGIVKKLENKLNVIHIKYEDLISNTESSMTNLLNSLGVPVDDNCFSTDASNKESKRNKLWENLSKPIIKNNTKKYIGKLNKFELKLIETICKEHMLSLGYGFETKANWKDYFGFYKKYVLPIKRKASTKKNKPFYEQKMKDLKSKQELLMNIRNEMNSKM